MYVIRERMIRLAEHSDITDEAGRTVLHVDGNVLSPRGRVTLADPAGHQVGEIHRKLAALRAVYEITIDGKKVAEIRKRPFTVFGVRFTIDVPGTGDMKINGDPLGHEFTIDRDGELVATISKRWLTLAATYSVDIAPAEDNMLILASVLALDMATDSERDG